MAKQRASMLRESNLSTITSVAASRSEVANNQDCNLSNGSPIKQSESKKPIPN